MRLSSKNTLGCPLSHLPYPSALTQNPGRDSKSNLELSQSVRVSVACFNCYNNTIRAQLKRKHEMHLSFAQDQECKIWGFYFCSLKLYTERLGKQSYMLSMAAPLLCELPFRQCRICKRSKDGIETRSLPPDFANRDSRQKKTREASYTSTMPQKPKIIPIYIDYQEFPT